MEIRNKNQVLDALNDAIYVLDKDGNVIYANNATVKLFGYSKSEMLKLNVYELNQNGTINICLLANTLEEKKQITRIQIFVTRTYPKGKKMLVTQFPVFDESGQVKISVGIIRDIRDLVLAYNSYSIEEGRIQFGQQKRKPLNNIIAADPKTLKLIGELERAANSDAAILITGESGVGKEVFADYIHSFSGRNNEKMVRINCASLPETLLEAELFGYEKGAFTGASATGKAGLIEEANHGTLFLDEINSMPLSIQGKMLRVLDTKIFRRIGSNKEIHVNFRLLSATNEDLQELIQEKKFRQDLYFRCNVIPINIPPLRERPKDIIKLCNFYLDYYNEKYSTNKALAEPLYQRLAQYAWPGNVRELKNFIERLILMTDESAQLIQDIPETLSDLTDIPNKPFTISPAENAMNHGEFRAVYNNKKSLKEQSAAFENWLIEQAVLGNGSLSKAAKQLQIDKTTLIRKRKK